MDQWKNIHEYGKRWSVEIYFSGLKRVMGVVIRARRPEYMIQEVGSKVLYYNMMRKSTIGLVSYATMFENANLISLVRIHKT